MSVSPSSAAAASSVSNNHSQENRRRTRPLTAEEELDLNRPGVAFRRVWFAVAVMNFLGRCDVDDSKRNPSQIIQLRHLNKTFLDAIDNGHLKLPFEGQPWNGRWSPAFVDKLVASNYNPVSFIRVLFDHHHGANVISTVFTVKHPCGDLLMCPLMGHALYNRNSSFVDSLVREFNVDPNEEIEFNEDVDPNEEIEFNEDDFVAPLYFAGQLQTSELAHCLLDLGAKDLCDQRCLLHLLVAGLPMRVCTADPDDPDVQHYGARNRLHEDAKAIHFSLIERLLDEQGADYNQRFSFQPEGPYVATCSHSIVSLAARLCARSYRRKAAARRRAIALQLLEKVLLQEKRFCQDQPRPPLTANDFTAVAIAVANHDVEALEMILKLGAAHHREIDLHAVSVSQRFGKSTDFLYRCGFHLDYRHLNDAYRRYARHGDDDDDDTVFLGDIMLHCCAWDVEKTVCSAYHDGSPPDSSLVVPMLHILVKHGVKWKGWDGYPEHESRICELFGGTPLVHAAKEGDLDLVRHFLAPGSGCSAGDFMYDGCICFVRDIMQLLSSSAGTTPRHEVLKQARERTLRECRRYCSGDTVLSAACSSKNVELLTLVYSQLHCIDFWLPCNIRSHPNDLNHFEEDVVGYVESVHVQRVLDSHCDLIFEWQQLAEVTGREFDVKFVRQQIEASDHRECFCSCNVRAEEEVIHLSRNGSETKCASETMLARIAEFDRWSDLSLCEFKARELPSDWIPMLMQAAPERERAKITPVARAQMLEGIEWRGRCLLTKYY